MNKNSREFRELCDKFIEIYRNSFNKEININDIIERESFKKIYRDLVKEYHTDRGIINDVMSEINNLRDKIRVFLDDPVFISTFKSESENIELDLNEYRSYCISRLKAKEDDYKEIWDIFKNEVEEFENLILFEKSKARITKLYFGFVSQLDNKLKKEKNIKQKTTYLRGFVDNRNSENVYLFYDFVEKVKKCYNIGDVAELYEPYEIKLRKNALAFLAKDSLSRLCVKYDDELLRRYIDEAYNSVKKIDSSNEDEFMRIYILYSNKIEIRRKNLDCYHELDELMRECSVANFEGIYIGEILQSDSIDSAEIVFRKMKELINDRIDYSRRVSARILGFLNKQRKNPENTFTYPFIIERVSKLFKYYDPSDKELSEFCLILEELEKEIEVQRVADFEKATRKKDIIRNKFLTDFSEGVFLPGGEKFLDYDLDNISTFGGFADFENKIIKMELPRVVSDIYNHLVIFEGRLKEKKDVEDKKDRLELL